VALARGHSRHSSSVTPARSGLRGLLALPPGCGPTGAPGTLPRRRGEVPPKIDPAARAAVNSTRGAALIKLDRFEEGGPLLSQAAMASPPSGRTTRRGRHCSKPCVPPRSRPGSTWRRSSGGIRVRRRRPGRLSGVPARQRGRPGRRGCSTSRGVARSPRRSGVGRGPAPSHEAAQAAAVWEAPYLRRAHDVLFRSCRRPARRSTWPGVGARVTNACARPATRCLVQRCHRTAWPRARRGWPRRPCGRPP
jgi:hypothetical protein